MIKKIASLVLLTALSYAGMAQSTENTPKKGRPDIPGTFLLDLGINRLLDKPSELKYGFWGSRTINVYYQYDMRIGKSKFSFHPGIGLGMERFKLLQYSVIVPHPTIPKDTVIAKPLNPTLVYDNNGNTTFLDARSYIYSDTLDQINWAESFSSNKSMMALNYLDIPFEFRFSTKPEDPTRSFKIALGGRVGYLLSSHTKIKYKEDGDLKKLKNKQHFNLTPIRYSVYTRIFIGNFNFFGYYNLSPLFKEGKGPRQTEATVYTVGISLASF